MAMVSEFEPVVVLRVGNRDVFEWWRSVDADAPWPIRTLARGLLRVELTREEAEDALGWAAAQPGWAEAQPKPIFRYVFADEREDSHAEASPDARAAAFADALGPPLT